MEKNDFFFKETTIRVYNFDPPTFDQLDLPPDGDFINFLFADIREYFEME